MNNTRCGSRPGTAVEGVLELALRHALEHQARRMKAAQDLRVPVGLHGVGPAVDRLDRAARRAPPRQACRGRTRRRRIRAPRSRAAARRLCGSLPPVARRRGAAASAEQLLPGGSEHLVRADALNQPLVQLMHQPVALRFVDHEGEVQIVRRLAHQVDLLVLEQFEGVAEFVQDAADVVTEQAQRSARSQDLAPGTVRRARSTAVRARGIQGVGGRDPATP